MIRETVQALGLILAVAAVLGGIVALSNLAASPATKAGVEENCPDYAPVRDRVLGCRRAPNPEPEQIYTNRKRPGKSRAVVVQGRGPPAANTTATVEPRRPSWHLLAPIAFMASYPARSERCAATASSPPA